MPTPYRWPLLAYFPSQIVFTLATHGCLWLGYSSESEQYEWAYTAGIIGVLVMSLMTGLIAALEHPRKVVMGLLSAFIVGALIQTWIGKVWYLGVPYSIHLLNAQIVVLLASGLLAIGGKHTALRILGALFLFLAAYDSGVLYDVNTRGQLFRAHAHSFHVVATFLAFASFAYFVRPHETSTAA